MNLAGVSLQASRRVNGDLKYQVVSSVKKAICLVKSCLKEDDADDCDDLDEFLK